MKRIILLASISVMIIAASCVSEYDLQEIVDYTNQPEGDDGENPAPCTPLNNTIHHDGTRIVYDDIFYSNIWGPPGSVLPSGKSLKGQDNNIGSQLNFEFNKPIVEGNYTVADYSAAGSIADDEVVVYGNFPINGSHYTHFAEPGTILKVELLSSGKWSASFCDCKFTVEAWTGWTTNFTTDGNLIQTYP